MSSELLEMMCSAAKAQLVSKYMAEITRLVEPSGAVFALVLSMECDHEETIFTIGNGSAEKTRELCAHGAARAGTQPGLDVVLEGSVVGELDPRKYRDA